MQSLKTVHLIFILAVIVLTDLFGAWAFYENSQTHDTATLIWGIVSFVVGFGAIGYGIWVVRKFDKTRLE